MAPPIETIELGAVIELIELGAVEEAEEPLPALADPACTPTEVLEALYRDSVDVGRLALDVGPRGEREPTGRVAQSQGQSGIPTAKLMLVGGVQAGKSHLLA
jgi:hypothetical protein